MAEIKFYAQGVSAADNDDAGKLNITHGAGSGIGFYGSSYGVSVPVGSYNTTTYHTNGDGTATDQTQMKNTKWASATTVHPGTASAVSMNELPNHMAPLNVRFTHGEAVAVQNCKLRIFDRSNVEQSAIGVETFVFECRHPVTTDGSTYQLDLTAGQGSSYDTNWFSQAGRASDGTLVPTDMVLTAGPGMSGLNTSAGDNLALKGAISEEGATHRSARHDWFLAMSASPDSIGSKTSYGLYFTCEYL
jgi:hypothetical protein